MGKGHSGLFFSLPCVSSCVFAINIWDRSPVWLCVCLLIIHILKKQKQTEKQNKTIFPWDGKISWHTKGCSLFCYFNTLKRGETSLTVWGGMWATRCCGCPWPDLLPLLREHRSGVCSDWKGGQEPGAMKDTGSLSMCGGDWRMKHTIKSNLECCSKFQQDWSILTGGHRTACQIT